MKYISEHRQDLHERIPNAQIDVNIVTKLREGIDKDNPRDMWLVHAVPLLWHMQMFYSIPTEEVAVELELDIKETIYSSKGI